MVKQKQQTLTAILMLHFITNKMIYCFYESLHAITIKFFYTISNTFSNYWLAEVITSIHCFPKVSTQCDPSKQKYRYWTWYLCAVSLLQYADGYFCAPTLTVVIHSSSHFITLTLMYWWNEIVQKKKKCTLFF